MEQRIEYIPKGVCSRKIELTLNDGIIKEVIITGGCDGNLKGLKSLLIGMDASDAQSRLAGIRCGFKDTSCPDQISKAIALALGQAAAD